MALINCPECSTEVSDRAPACVRCGCPLKAPGGGANKVKSSAGAVASDAPADRLIENGNTHIKLNNYAEAQKHFSRATEEYPGDYRGWWGMILCATANFTKGTNYPNTLDKWFGHVRQLADPNECDSLGREYAAYIGKAAIANAAKDIAKANGIINDANAKIASITQRQTQIEQEMSQRQKAFKKKRWDSAEADEAIVKRDKLEDKLKRDKFIIVCCFIASIIVGLIAAAIGEGGISLLIVVLGLFSCFFGFLFLKLPRLRYGGKTIKGAIAKLNDFIDNEEIKMAKRRKEETKRYSEEMTNADKQIEAIGSEIAQAQKSIADCTTYMALGENRIANALFAMRCEKIGIKQQMDGTAIELRRAALGVEPEPEEEEFYITPTQFAAGIAVGAGGMGMISTGAQAVQEQGGGFIGEVMGGVIEGAVDIAKDVAIDVAGRAIGGAIEWLLG